MNIDTSGLIYFSPTQGTKKIVEAIADGINSKSSQTYDLTYPPDAARGSKKCECDLAVIGAPVYAGRLPGTMTSRFELIKGDSTPAVIVVVYGNRAYEDALLELNDLAVNAGFIPVASAAFSAEHSFATDEFPVAMGRPDQEDLNKAKAFGKTVREKAAAISDPREIVSPKPPGNSPYKEQRIFAGITPSVDESLCTKCMTCVSLCPTAAISEDDPLAIETDLCIRCCACIKSCPTEARTMTHPKIRQIAEFLSKNHNDRKEPEMYL
ncbi:MAG: 4Fe-4S binding protein [Syntrophaceae bacterium]|nr:4Fe-4S binding protein [Syntrophaceae bacterium]